VRHWRTELRKHVLPTLCRPAPTGIGLLHASIPCTCGSGHRILLGGGKPASSGPLVGGDVAEEEEEEDLAFFRGEEEVDFIASSAPSRPTAALMGVYLARNECMDSGWRA